MFNVGEKVKRINTATARYPVGSEGTVTRAGEEFIGVDGRNYRAENWEVVVDDTIIRVGDYVRRTEASNGNMYQGGVYLVVRERSPGNQQFQFEGVDTGRGWWSTKYYEKVTKAVYDEYLANQPKLPFAAGDVVISNGYTYAPYIADKAAYIVVGIAGNRYGRNYGVQLQDIDTKAGIGGTHYWDATKFTKAPAGWKPPPKPELDLASLTLGDVGLTNPAFGSCCGAQIIYSYYMMGSRLQKPGFSHILITAEHYEAAIDNHLRNRAQGTGVVLSILATTQIALYGPILERCGFVKVDEYPNYNHGANHMNALYMYVVRDNRGKAKEAKKMF